MNKSLWNRLKELFTNEEIREKYSDVAEVVDKVCKSIELKEELDALTEELNELNK